MKLAVHFSTSNMATNPSFEVHIFGLLPRILAHSRHPRLYDSSWIRVSPGKARWPFRAQVHIPTHYLIPIYINLRALDTPDQGVSICKSSFNLIINFIDHSLFNSILFKIGGQMKLEITKIVKSKIFLSLFSNVEDWIKKPFAYWHTPTS